MEEFNESELEKRLEELQQQAKGISDTLEYIYNQLEQHTVMLLLTQLRQDRTDLNLRVNIQYLLEKMLELVSIKEGGSGGRGGQSSQQQMNVEPAEPTKQFQLPTRAQTNSNIQTLRNKAHPGQLPPFQPPSSSSGHPPKR